MKPTHALLSLLMAATALAQGNFYPASRHGGNYMHNYYLPPAPSSTPWAPAWSPDGKSIAFAMHGSIWKLDVASGEATELTYNSSYHSSPAWSPDGKWIIYTADTGMAWVGGQHQRIQLEILEVATRESSPLTEDQHLYLDPVFSPDGSQVAYVSTQPSGYFNIYVREFRDGAWSGRPVAVTKDNRYPRDRLYFGPWDMHIEPAWTPDGKELLFLSNRGVPLGSGHIWRMPAVENGIQDARAILTEQSLYRARPDVSIDGKRFAYASSGGASDAFTHLYVLPVEGGAPYKMTFGDHDDFHPRWSPDGEKIAYISNQGGLPQLTILETYGGKKTRVGFSRLNWKRPVGEVRLEVLDGSGRPVPARIQGRASDGKFYVPEDTYARIGMYGQHFFHTAGVSTFHAPPGPLEITAIKGFEYWPLSETVQVEPGKSTTVRLHPKRFTDFSAKGWFSGSTHVHMNYGGNLRNTLENLMLMSKAEGQDVVNELVANKDNRILDWMYFEPGGGEHSVSKNDPSMVLMVGEEYRPPFYGHVFYLGLKENLISPFTTGYEGTGIESLYPSNTDMFRKARAQGAVTGYVHPMSGEGDPLDGELGVAKGFPVDLALGVIDGYEWSSSTRGQLRVWHHALNNDFRIAPTGGEDSISNLHLTKVVGSLRTYVHTGGTLSAEAWLEALRGGASFFSSAPLLEFEIDGKRPGEAVTLPAQGGKVRLKARVWSSVPLSKVVIHSNGKVFREIPVRDVWSRGGEGDAAICAQLDEEIAVQDSRWFSLYAEGPYTPLLDVLYPQAATNAIRVYSGERKILNRASAEYFIRWIDKLESMARAWPWWRSQKEQDHVYAQFAEAREVYRKLADQAR